MTGTLRIGTSSWSSKGWVGCFYPPGTRPGDMLIHYGEHFDTVEADVTYYRVPDQRLVEGWRRKTPRGFRLAAKFPRSIVHGGEGARPDPARVLRPEYVRSDAERFLQHMQLMGDKLGPLVLQFPYFNRQVFASKAPFLERLEAFLNWIPPGFRIAVEVRNKSWIGEDLLELLRAHGVALCLVDLLYMPHPAELAEKHDLCTGDFVYGRLIGDRKAVDALTTTFDSIVIDRSAQLAQWAEVLRAMLERVPEAYVYANNHYAGHGPDTVRELAALMDVELGPAERAS